MKVKRNLAGVILIVIAGLIVMVTSCQKEAQPTAKPETSENHLKAAFPKPPTTTLLVNEVTANSMKCNVTVTLAKGAPPVTERGVVFSTVNPIPTILHTKIVAGTGTGSFVVPLNNLENNTVYNVRSYAINSDGIGYSSVCTWATTTPVSGECNGLLFDARNNKSYKTIQINGQCWMAENLNYGIRIGKEARPANDGVVQKYCYNDLESNCTTYGALYTWGEIMQYAGSSNQNPSGVQGICPDGWHVPSYGEITQLGQDLGGDMATLGGKMKEMGTSHWKKPNTGATNSTGLTTLGTGRLGFIQNTYEFQLSATFNWSTTKFFHESYPTVDFAWLFGQLNSSAALGIVNYRIEAVANPLRCVKDPVAPVNNQ